MPRPIIKIHLTEKEYTSLYGLMMETTMPKQVWASNYQSILDEMRRAEKEAING